MFVRMEGAMRVHKVTRVWEVAKVAGVESSRALAACQRLGYPVRSASSRLDLEPIEREALIATVLAY